MRIIEQLISKLNQRSAQLVDGLDLVFSEYQTSRTLAFKPTIFETTSAEDANHWPEPEQPSASLIFDFAPAQPKGEINPLEHRLIFWLPHLLFESGTVDDGVLQGLATNLLDILSTDKGKLTLSSAVPSVTLADVTEQLSQTTQEGTTHDDLPSRLQAVRFDAADTWAGMFVPSAISSAWFGISLDPPPPAAPEPSTTEAKQPPRDVIAMRPAAPAEPLPEGVRRLMRLQIPISVELAHRQMPAIRVFELALGSVIEFNRSCNEPLILTANGRPIGSGEAVKVGEHFGLRISTMDRQRA